MGDPAQQRGLWFSQQARHRRSSARSVAHVWEVAAGDVYEPAPASPRRQRFNVGETYEGRVYRGLYWVRSEKLTRCL